jgi:2,5-diketo-D-gluconate reductase A
VALRWALQSGLVVLPRSANRQRIAQNRQLWGWCLTAQQMLQVEALGKGT